MQRKVIIDELVDKLTENTDTDIELAINEVLDFLQVDSEELLSEDEQREANNVFALINEKTGESNGK